MSQPFLAELPSMALAVAGKGALISLAALGAAAGLRRSSAARRHLVLALAAVGLLALPVLVAGLPSWDLAVMPLAPDPSPTPSLLPGEGNPDVPPASQAFAPLPAGREGRGEGGQGGEGLLLLLPLAVSCLLLARMGVGLYRLSRLRAGSRPAPPELQALVDRHRERLEIGRPVRLAVSAEVAVPVTFGWIRPVVLLPEAALGWDAQPLREALVHELSHVRRHDWPVQVMARAACALHWFDPLAWMLCRRLLLEAELACDDQVLRTGAAAEGYAERLVALARQARGAARRPAAAVAFARPSGLARRVAALLDSGRRRGGPGRIAVAGAAVAALVLLLLVAPARLVRAESKLQRAVRQGVAGALQERDSVVEGVQGGLEDGVPGSVRGGVEGGVREGLEGGIEDGVEEGRQGALVEAAADGDLEAVRFLLESGADPNSVVPREGTPLIAASRAGHLEIVRLLLTVGAHVDQVVPGDENPLIQAAWNGRLEIARLLLEAGADPNVRVVANRSPRFPDGVVRTPLRMARQGGHREMERLLIEAGAKD